MKTYFNPMVVIVGILVTLPLRLLHPSFDWFMSQPVVIITIVTATIAWMVYDLIKDFEEASSLKDKTKGVE